MTTIMHNLDIGDSFRLIGSNGFPCNAIYTVKERFNSRSKCQTQKQGWLTVQWDRLVQKV